MSLLGIFAYKTPYSVLIDNSIRIQEIDTEKTFQMHQTFISFAIKIPLYRIGQIFSIKVVIEAQVNLWHFTVVFLKSMYCLTNLILIPNSQGPPFTNKKEI